MGTIGNILLNSQGLMTLDPSGLSYLYDTGGCNCCACTLTDTDESGGQNGSPPQSIAGGITFINKRGPDAHNQQQSQLFAAEAGVVTIGLQAPSIFPNAVVAPFINFLPRAFNNGLTSVGNSAENTVTVANGDLIEFLFGFPTVADFVNTVPYFTAPIILGLGDMEFATCPPTDVASLPSYAQAAPSTVTVTIDPGTGAVTETLTLTPPYHGVSTYTYTSGGYPSPDGTNAIITISWLGAPYWVLVQCKYGVGGGGPVFAATAPYTGPGDSPTGKTWTIIWSNDGTTAVTVT